MRTTMLVLMLLAADAPEASQLEVPQSIQEFLTHGKWDSTPRGFRIVTLSNIAEGCAAQGKAVPARLPEARVCLSQVYGRALKTVPAASIDQVADAMWLAHFNLILDATDQLGPCANEKLHRAIAGKLAVLSLADPHGIAPSYASLPDRWPADQSVVLASLKQFDAAHTANLTDAPLERFEKAIHQSIDVHELPPSEMSAHRATSKLPRGCANSFLSRYLAQVDAPLSSEIWKIYRRDWLVTLGPVTGFREWPPGIERGSDVDSGPIVAGIGTAASALAMAAARAQGDEALALHLEASAALAMQLAPAGQVKSQLLADAIRFQAHWQPRLVE